jgi:hypothetical protein
MNADPPKSATNNDRQRQPQNESAFILRSFHTDIAKGRLSTEENYENSFSLGACSEICAATS